MAVTAQMACGLAPSTAARLQLPEPGVPSPSEALPSLLRTGESLSL